MKRIVLFWLLIGISQSHGHTQSLEKMTPNTWKTDLDYLHKKIDREFSSFNEGIKIEFDRNVVQLNQQLDQFNNHEVAIKIGQLMASLGDGHTEMSILQRNANFNRLPINVYFFAEGLYITYAQEEYKAHVGAQILKIGNKPIPDVIQQLKTIMTYDNDFEILHAGPSFLILPQVLFFLGITKSPDTVMLSLMETSGKVSDLALPSLSIDEYLHDNWVDYLDMNKVEPTLSQENPTVNYWYRYLPDVNTMYFNFDRVNNQKGQPGIKKIIKKMFHKIDEQECDKLIVDLRENNGGNYYKSRPLVEAIKKRPWLKEHVFVITGRRTFSAAMVTAIFLKKETDAVIVGEPSRGHPNRSDNVEYMTLPNSKLNIEYTTRVKKHWPELGEADHVPVDVEIPPTFASWSKGIDPVLEYILTFD